MFNMVLGHGNKQKLLQDCVVILNESMMIREKETKGMCCGWVMRVLSLYRTVLSMGIKSFFIQFNMNIAATALLRWCLHALTIYSRRHGKKRNGKAQVQVQLGARKRANNTREEWVYLLQFPSKRFQNITFLHNLNGVCGRINSQIDLNT